MRHRSIYLLLPALAFVAACGGATVTTEQETMPASQTPPATSPSVEQAASATQPQPPASSVSMTPPATETPAPVQARIPAAETKSVVAKATPPTPKPTATAQAAPSLPRSQTIELPAGTVIEMELLDNLSSKLNVAGDIFKARVIDPISMGGIEVIPIDSIVEGTVTEAVSAKQMTGQASLTLQFTKITLPGGESVGIEASLSEKGKKIGKRTAGIVGGSAAGGAVLGRIIGKDTKGAVIGAVLGAAVGTGVASSQKGQELKLPAGTGVSIELASPAQVTVPQMRG